MSLKARLGSPRVQELVNTANVQELELDPRMCPPRTWQELLERQVLKGGFLLLETNRPCPRYVTCVFVHTERGLDNLRKHYGWMGTAISTTPLVSVLPSKGVIGGRQKTNPD